jgi:predicted RNase H-like HicB family nuclease
MRRAKKRYNRVVDEITISISTCEETGTLVASWDDPSGSGGLTTQADRLSDLERNIREAVAVHFEPGEQPKHLRLHFMDDPVLAAA